VADDKDIIETHMGHVRDSLHEIRNQLNQHQLVHLDMATLKEAVNALDEDIKDIKEWMKLVQENKDNITKLHTQKNLLASIFAFLLSVVAYFKR
jgi:archaellum component FlaC